MTKKMWLLLPALSLINLGLVTWNGIIAAQTIQRIHEVDQLQTQLTKALSVAAACI